MKRSSFSPAAYGSAVVLSLAISLGIVLCPVTAFALPCRIFAVAGVCLLASLVLPLLYFLPRQKLVWPLFWLCLLAAAYLLRAPIWDGFRYAALQLSTQYSLAYAAFTPLVLGGSILTPLDTTGFFCGAGALVCLLVCWTVLRRQTIVPVCCLFLLDLVLSLLDLTCFPALPPLLLLLGGMLLLALSHSARLSGPQGDKLALLLILPTVLFLGLLLLLFPKKGYERSEWSDSLQSRVTNALARLPLLEEQNGRLVFSPTDFGSVFDTASVNLRWVGPQGRDDREVMSIKATQDGTIYLRGAALGDYTGSTWEPLSPSVYQNAGLDHWGISPIWEAQPQNSLSVRTNTTSHVLYTPYFSPPFSPTETNTQFALGVPYYDAYLRNTSALTQYTIPYTYNGWNPTSPKGTYLPVLQLLSTYISTTYTELDSWSGGKLLPSLEGVRFQTPSMLDWETQNGAYSAFVESYYTQLPNSTRTALQALIRAKGLDLPPETMDDVPPRAAAAFTVAEYVRASASYDLNTPRMPLGKDFVLWFLEDSDTGYCVHFASATVALLRAMDIPARYVTGYTVQAEAEKWVPVTVSQAHAWAEFYLPGLGWVPLESTPGDFSVPPPAMTEPTVLVTPPTVTTAPTEATLPGETTHPTEESAAPGTTPTVPSETLPDGKPGVTIPGPNSRPSGPAGAAPEGSAKPQIPWEAITRWALIVLLPPLLLILYRAVILLARQRALRGSDLNRRAIAQYLHLKKLARSAGIPIPQALTDLAKKARFSKQGVTRPELQAMAQFHCALLPILRKKPWYRRFWDRWIRVLY